MTKLKLTQVASSLSADDFLNIESRFNIIFPSSLKEHYLLNNGGASGGYKCCW
jgi:hypothetical protein